MLYPLGVRLCHALHYPSLSQAGEVTVLQAQFLGVDFDVVLAELGRKTTLAQRRGAGPYERSQHGQRGSKLRMWHLLKILPRLELGVVHDIARGISSNGDSIVTTSLLSREGGRSTTRNSTWTRCE